MTAIEALKLVRLGVSSRAVGDGAMPQRTGHDHTEFREIISRDDDYFEIHECFEIHDASLWLKPEEDLKPHWFGDLLDIDKDFPIWLKALDLLKPPHSPWYVGALEAL